MVEKVCKECGLLAEHRWNTRCRKCADARTAARLKANPELTRQKEAAKHRRRMEKNPNLNTEKARKRRERYPGLNKERFRRRMELIEQGAVSSDDLKAIYEKCGGKCAYCGTPVECQFGQKTFRGFDHVIPFAKGGKHEIGNLVVCCRPCNSIKRDELWTPKEAKAS